MLAFACFFGFQFTKNDRLQKEKDLEKQKPNAKPLKKKGLK
jgi:hypothetical protein